MKRAYAMGLTVVVIRPLRGANRYKFYMGGVLIGTATGAYEAMQLLTERSQGDAE